MLLLQFFKLFWICLEGLFPPFLFCFLLLWLDVYRGYTIFFYWKALYCQHKYAGNIPKAICRLNVSPVKLPMSFFAKLVQEILSFMLKHRRSWITKEILKNKNGTGKIKPHDFRLTETYINQNGMLLSQKQKYRSMEPDRKPRNKLLNLWSTNLCKVQNIYNGEKTIFSVSIAGKWDSYLWKKWNLKNP